ncbi:hypothetical protein BABINDRAFT_52814 [Babjeviella inositovora NRRL Y-12698]|uniref:Chromatin remodelling complex ATPase chain ISW1 n=1 Tax=Babjeviella inositovora NRRL Y-12698 TaxID=984486 RepID=A0A1E3QKJ9_9ASCO|nr:uncharacterized protein BABINDRAFT_52814 [Babjeviella inositovora NRRL Y-12698]ODQ78226.1 hypothetical protein BABINDRAFT_52814 [Babjeviella inositovora NRRL Y-12698]
MAKNTKDVQLIASDSEMSSIEEVEVEDESESIDDDDIYDGETFEDRKARYLLQEDVKVVRAKDTESQRRRLKHLLGLTDLFRQFVDLNLAKNPKLKKMIKQLDAEKKGMKGAGARRRKTEQEEDEELIYDETTQGDYDKTHTLLTESPAFVKSGTMREYQIQGLNWLVALHENALSGILADEMGLGKTLQTIAFLGYLRYVKDINGPHIVIVPKSTLDNWRREFAKWTPDVRVTVLQGAKDERTRIILQQLMKCKFDVVITSFEMVIREKAALKKFRWQYIIVDEAHRIKNEESALSQIIRLFYSQNRLLITGTPLQNNLHELWALLNFILPDIFGDSDVFDRWFDQQRAEKREDELEEGNTDDENEERQDKVIQQLHNVLSPFLLRRIKADVEHSLLPKKEVNLYVGMSEMQIRWYRKLLEKDIDAVNGVVGKREGKTRLLNIVMQLRKCCNHPYLFEGAEPGPPYTTDEHLVYNSGKMVILDKLLKRMQKQGSRVLIFSQMSRLLDVLEDYCMFRGFEYSRIDGSTSHEDRIEAIDEYNKPDSEKFVFLLTTRAGGLGINLTSADVVVLYDSDWNPQADLQAMDRAHRIGQKKQVYVYRFVTENAIEEKVLERAAQKLRLDQLVIQQGRNSGAQTTVGNSKDDLLSMIQHGAHSLFDNRAGGEKSLDQDIDEILRAGEQKTATLNAKYSKLGLDDLQNFTESSSAYEWNGQNFATKKSLLPAWINPSKRERKEQTYSVDNYYKDMMTTKVASGRNPRAPKQIVIQTHQFFPPQLQGLLDREMYAFKKKVGHKVQLGEFGDSDEEYLEDEFVPKVSRETKRAREQQKIKDAVELTEEEVKLKEEYISQGFTEWSKRDFTDFIHASARYGRDSYDLISQSLRSKTPEEVERYAKVFWEKYQAIEGHEKYVAQIEAGEHKALKLRTQNKFLKQKIESCAHPLEAMAIQYPPNNSKRVYSLQEDRFLLCMVHKHGLLTENLYEMVREEIVKSDLFRFNWYFASRSAQELGRRANTLLLAVTREFEGPNALKNRKRALAVGVTKDSSIDPGSDIDLTRPVTPLESKRIIEDGAGGAEKKVKV